MQLLIYYHTTLQLAVVAAAAVLSNQPVFVFALLKTPLYHHVNSSVARLL